jgi:hypothetical protein
VNVLAPVAVAKTLLPLKAFGVFPATLVMKFCPVVNPCGELVVTVAVVPLPLIELIAEPLG